MQLLAFSLASLATVIDFSPVHAVDGCSLPTDVSVGRSPIAEACNEESGFDMLPVIPPTQDLLKRMCASDTCRTLTQQLNEAFPIECNLLGVPLRATVINALNQACAAPTSPPPSGFCGNDQVGAQSCPSGQYCQPWNPTDYQCRTIDAKCGVQEVGVDYYGNDLATLQLQLPEDCCNACTTTVGCTGYTFVNYNSDGKAYCYLKQGSATKTPKIGAVSATVVKFPAPQCSRQLANIDLYGNDITQVYGVSIDECCSQCRTTTGCKAYTYVTGDKACYLKSSDLRVSEGVVSAAVVTNSPTQCSAQLANIDLYGNDISAVYGVSVDQCCNQCGSTAGCKGYTYVASATACYLKSSDLRVKEGVVTGILN